MQSTSSEIAHAEDYAQRHGNNAGGGMNQCCECGEHRLDTRDVDTSNHRFTIPLCRDCRPFDHPCEACGNAECHPGCDSCLACEIIGDLHSVRAEIAGAM